MRKFFKSVQLFTIMLVAGTSLCFTACSDDNDEIQIPDEVTTEIMFGAYKGTMTTSEVATVEGEDDGQETEPATEVSATIEDNTIRFAKFPIRDIVLSIVGDETLADKIVEAVGDLDYSISYEPTLAPEKDFILMTLKPKPLKLAVEIPALQEGDDAQILTVEVQIEAGETTGYNIKEANVKFSITATKVMLGEGDEQQELGNFVSTTFRFDMNQCKVAHNI